MELYVIAGLSGAGKTTFINQCMRVLSGKTVILQNELGEEKINVNTDVGIYRKELTEGCVCCTLALDFKQSIREIIEEYHPDRVLIEASSSAYLKEVAKACMRAKEKEDFLDIKLITVVDLSCLEECLEGLGCVFSEQIQSAKLLFVSHVNAEREEENEKLFDMLRKLNPKAIICKKDFKELEQTDLKNILRNTESWNETGTKMIYLSGKKSTASVTTR